MQTNYILDKRKVQSSLDKSVEHAKDLTVKGDLAAAIQIYDTILCFSFESSVLSYINFQLSLIYQEWNEVFVAQRFLEKAHQLNPDDTNIRDEFGRLNHHIAQNQTAFVDERARKNSDLIVSLFRIATGFKLLQMGKSVQAYPLMKSRTKVYPNAAVAKHLLTDIVIADEEKNSAIMFLETRNWLASRRPEFYTFAESGLYKFYVELAKLHTANEAYSEGSACYRQAYWLNDSNPDLLYLQVICDANAQAWTNGLSVLNHLGNTPPEPENVNSAACHRAIAQIYGVAYTSSGNEDMGKRAIEACNTVLGMNRKDKEISRLLKSLTSLAQPKPGGGNYSEAKKKSSHQ